MYEVCPGEHYTEWTTAHFTAAPFICCLAMTATAEWQSRQFTSPHPLPLIEQLTMCAMATVNESALHRCSAILPSDDHRWRNGYQTARQWPADSQPLPLASDRLPMHFTSTGHSPQLATLAALHKTAAAATVKIDRFHASVGKSTLACMRPAKLLSQTFVPLK